MPSGNIATGTLNRIARTNAALGGNLVRTAEYADPAWRGHHRVSARHRHHRERHRSDYGVCACQWPPYGLHSGDQARRCVHAVGDQCGEGGDPGLQEGGSRRCGCAAGIRPVAICTEFDPRFGGGGSAGRGADGPDGADLPARLAQRADCGPEYSLCAAQRSDSTVGHRSDDQHHDPGRPGAGCGCSGGRGDGRDREHTHADAARRITRACSGRGLQPHGDGADALYVLHTGGLRALVFYGRCGAPALCAALSRGGIFDDRFLPVVEQPGAGLLDVADERGPSRRGKGRTVRLPAQVLLPLSRRDPAIPVAAGGGLSGWGGGAAGGSAAAHGYGDFPRPGGSHPSHTAAGTGGYACGGDRTAGAARARRD